jgi:hypothetical protein
MAPTPEQAVMFATLVFNGVPPAEAILFADPGLDPSVRLAVAKDWLREKGVLDAQVRLQGGDWLTLTDAQRFALARDKDRRSAAWFLLTHVLAEAGGADYAKLKDCRAMIEQITTATGPSDASAQFWADIMAGKRTFVVQESPKPKPGPPPERVQ